MKLKIMFAAAVALAAVAGCRTESPPTVPSSNAAVTGSARVPAGTMFTVRMIDSLSTDTAVAGRAFTARLRDPLMGVAPPNAIVTGRVVAVERGERPRLALSFETLATYDGTVPIDARAESAINAPFAIDTLRTAEEGDADVVLSPLEPTAIGGGPPAEEGQRPPSVNVDYDTEIDLVLTSPLVVGRSR